ncbi:phage Gp37/Gp68 family protein [Sphingopyxis granuli]|uniref:phage Gp37/Gp68 family protein n=1 Tax=Sphingopyxis granuli TaxID=267128 RepID=UPI001BAF4F9C|nr:phage Gp37/Gp68 family protein [Sphingopyxis granuli]QUM73315.1 phage Gp37/Gp68 family protein [Sphingopyxis granuli]
MSDGSAIEWTDATVNAINGCSLASPGCTNCYAMRLAGTRMKNHPSRKGLTVDTKAGPVWNGEVRLVESALLQPLCWQRSRIIFWNAHGDTFHDAVPDEWIDLMFAVMAMTPQHKHLVLTKRSARMRAYLSDDNFRGRISDMVCAWPADRIGTGNEFIADWRLMAHHPLPNVWLGVSVEDQARADERIPDLLATPAAGRFLSCEPLLGPIDLRWIAEPDEEKDGVIDALLGCNWIDGMGWGTEFRPVRPGHEDRVMTRRVCSSEEEILAARKIDGVIVGGESGPGARPMHPAWTRSLRDQCAAAGVDFHFKQWGNIAPLQSARPVEGEGAGIVAWPDGTIGGGQSERNGGPGQQMYRAEKKIAGRLLDGVTHDALPWTRQL